MKIQKQNTQIRLLDHSEITNLITHTITVYNYYIKYKYLNLSINT